MSAVTTFGDGADLRARFEWMLPVAPAERPVLAVELRRSLERAGLAPVLVEPAGDRFRVDLDLREGAAQQARALAAWRSGDELPAWPVRVQPHTLSDLADAIGFIPLDSVAARGSAASVVDRVRRAPMRVQVAAGTGAVSAAAECARSLPTETVPPAPDVSSAATAAVRPAAGRRWARLPGDAELALVRRARLMPAPRGWQDELAADIAHAEFGARVDSTLAAVVRGRGLSYSPHSRIVAGTPALLVIDVPVAAGDELDADAAIGAALRIFPDELDPGAARRRAAGASIVEADSLRGRLDAAHRSDARAERWIDIPDLPEAELIGLVDTAAIAAAATALTRADAFDTLVLSPHARPDGWEDL